MQTDIGKMMRGERSSEARLGTVGAFLCVMAVAVGAMVLAISSGPAVAALGNAASQIDGLAGPEEDESLSDWTDRWLEGPTGLIATKEEARIYDELDSVQERLQFIRLFWNRRDPQVRGGRNEFLDEFVERLAYADEHFSEGDKAGWQTLFGRVVMVYGPPSRTRRDMTSFPVGFSNRPAVLWTYDKRLPQIPPNENLLFAFRRGRWRLMPPSPIGDTGVAAQARALERASDLVVIAGDYQRSFYETIDETLVNPVDYTEAIDRVRSRFVVPKAQIPFSWTARSSVAAAADGAKVDIDLTWRMDTLVFHLVGTNFETDMTIDVQLLRDGVPVATTSERVTVEVPESEMEGRRDEIVRRSVSLEAEPGTYVLELTLLDQILGYRTIYRDDLEVTR